MEFEFIIEGKEFSFDTTSMTRTSDEGCSGITFGLNLTIIILVVDIIIVIGLLLVIFGKMILSLRGNISDLMMF